MHAFVCPVCSALVPFEVVTCLRCHTELGYSPGSGDIAALAPEAARCANQALAGCNWLVPPGEDPDGLCRSCRLTRTRPNDAELGAGSRTAESFTATEAAKRRLIFQLEDLGLPVGAGGPEFDLLSSVGGPVITGHEDGVVTIDLAESDDAHRERMRQELDEPYRTMLGHLRHETGHYYWPILVTGGERLDRCRALFGDESADYAEALSRHYDEGPPEGWAEVYVSSYGSAHPWEDWAETFAHYLHIRDTLQTAAAYGMLVTGPAAAYRDMPNGATPAPDLMAAPTLEPAGTVDEILDDWLPLTYALNAVNRSMGKGDLYPFVLSPTIIDKLSFVHSLVGRLAARRA